MNEYDKNSDELYHWGRKGMKWYQHIYTNIKDAAINYKNRKIKESNIKENTKQQIKKLKRKAKEEARRRKIQKIQDEKINKAKKHIKEKYNIDYGKDDIPNKEKNQNSDTSKIKETNKVKNNLLTNKQISKLSDQEIKDRYNRLTNEKNLIELQKYHASNGKKFINIVNKDVLIPAATNASRDLVTSFLKKYGDIAIESLEANVNKKRNK